MMKVWKSWEPTKFTPKWLISSSSQSIEANAPVILSSSAPVGLCLSEAQNYLWFLHREMYWNFALTLRHKE